MTELSKWAPPAVAAAVAAGGVLLIDDDKIELAFLAVLCLATVRTSALLERRGRTPGRDAPGGREGLTFLVPLLLALVVSRLFDDDDLRLAALFVLAVAFAFAWSLLVTRRRARPGG